MGNKSAEYPEGYLNGDILKTFSITGESGSFVWKDGYERVPDNWYKRAIGDEYTIPFFMSDLGAATQQYLQFLDIGGNTGKLTLSLTSTLRMLAAVSIIFRLSRKGIILLVLLSNLLSKLRRTC
jgi:hypothetical protein